MPGLIVLNYVYIVIHLHFCHPYASNYYAADKGVDLARC